MPYALRQPEAVLTTDELLARLEQKKIRNVDIARALGLPDSRVPEIRTKRRKLTLDEGAKLVRAFALEQTPPATALPPSIARLVVRYIATELRAAEDEAKLEEIAEDVRAFSAFVADPSVRSSIQAAETFFQAMRLRRPHSEEEARSGSDPARAG
jgi:hypothetical protein